MTMQGTELPYNVLESHSEILLNVERWNVREMVLTRPKLVALWAMMERHKTLFSDLTKGDFDNWVRYLASPDSYWLEVYEGNQLVGIINFTDTHQCVDMLAHMVFFDRQPREKLEVCRQVMLWMFKHFHINRITIMPPVIYYATIRLVEALGFKEEGCKRGAVLIGGKWIDQKIYGMLREEAECLS